MEQKFIPRLGDSHFHILEMQRKGWDPLPLLGSWFEGGFTYLLDAGVDMEGWTVRTEAAEVWPHLYLGAGWHPHCAAIPGFEPDWSLLENQLSHPKTIALGEIGLDYYRNPQNKKEQQNLLMDQLNWAEKTKKPIILHNREADADLLGILKEADLTAKGVFHCFSSGVDTARQALDLGYFLSFSGNLTYPSAVEIRGAAAFAPADRILVETDSPYLAPIPHRGKNNSPPLVELVLLKLAEVQGADPQTLAGILEKNFCRLFNPPGW